MSHMTIEEIREKIRLGRQKRKDGTLRRPPPPPCDDTPPPGFSYDAAEVPEGAVDLAAGLMTAAHAFYIPSSGLVLKTGPFVRSAEAEAMRFIATHTSIPVPVVHKFYEKNGFGYILMSRAEGVMLGDVWDSLTEEKRATIISQLKVYVDELRQLSGDFYGKIGRLGCEDIFFRHLCVAHRLEHNKHPYGPFETRAEYNEGLVQALRNSRPPGQWSAGDEELAARIRALKSEEKVYSHGDLHLGNIFVDEKGNITRIIDWGGAGFSIPQRDYFEAKLRGSSQKTTWNDALELVFSENVKENVDFFTELNIALTKYSGF